jgi:hypothetical protein
MGTVPRQASVSNCSMRHRGLVHDIAPGLPLTRITVTGPALGLLFIYLSYRGCLSWQLSPKR